MLLFIKSTKIAGGFNPRYAAVANNINCDNERIGLIGFTWLSSNSTTGINNILNTFFANDQMINESSTKTTIKTSILFDSKSERKIKNSLTNKPDGGIAVTLINAKRITMAPVGLYLK